MLGLESGILFGNRYEIIRCIGAGGMGAVYLACDPRYREFLVALKVLYPGVIKTAEARERFRNEIVASYRVNHRNVVRAYEFFDDPNYQAYAMEYVDGGDLGMRMVEGPNRKRFSPEQVVDMLHQIACGLEAIHAAGIVHRDLKPENLLLCKDGTLKISDFGVARLRGSVTLTAVGAMVGTPKYVSPEYVETGECDHRGDIYAAGLIAYELLSGSSPFKCESRVSVMMERFKLDLNELVVNAPGAPVELLKIVRKAMAVDLAERYQNAQQLSYDLDLFIAGKPAHYANGGTIADPRQVTSSISDAFEVRDAIRSRGDTSKDLPRLRLLEEKRKKERRATALIASLSLATLVAGIGMRAWWSSLTEDAAISDTLKAGTYKAELHEFGGPGSQLNLTIWRTALGVFGLIPKAGCAVQEIASDGKIACGEISLILKLNPSQDGRLNSGTAFSTRDSGSWPLTLTEQQESSSSESNENADSKSPSSEVERIGASRIRQLENELSALKNLEAAQLAKKLPQELAKANALLSARQQEYSELAAKIEEIKKSRLSRSEPIEQQRQEMASEDLLLWGQK